MHADDFVRAAYHGELGRFSRGIYGRLAESDPEEYRRRELEFLEEKLADLQSHLKTCLEHLTATQQRQIVIVLDNVDQRPQSFQDEVFLMAQGFAARWPASVFVALRPDTFYRSTASGSLSGYQTQVFTIAPPRVERAVYKRLRFAKAQLKSKKTLEVLGDGVTFESRTLDLYLDALLQSFAKNQDLVELVDNLSNGNIRRAFDFLKAFIGSGHVDTEKILKAMREDGHYLVAVHEFLRAVIYGDNEFYDPLASFVPNLFDISTRDGREHFLLPLLLTYIQLVGEGAVGHGYVGLDDIQSFALGLNYRENQVDYALQRAESKKLVEKPILSAGDDGSGRYRITTVGAYADKRLVASFPYVDAVVVDTPIVDEDARNKIHSAASIFDRACARRGVQALPRLAMAGF